MELSDFQKLYHGFEHAGLRTELNPERSVSGDIAACWIVDVDSGKRVGALFRHRFERDGRTWLDGGYTHLKKRYRGRGFVSTQFAETHPKVKELGIYAVRSHVQGLGATLWHRWGIDFDLAEVEGSDERRRRARVVATIFSPDAPRNRRFRRIPRWLEPNPHLVLRAREKKSGAGALAAAAIRRHIPTEAQIESGELDGTFARPGEIVDFEAHGVPIGHEAMRYAHYDGYRLV